MLLWPWADLKLASKLQEFRKIYMGIKIISKNKRATYDYAFEETFEAGLVLQGTEVKTLREG